MFTNLFGCSSFSIVEDRSGMPHVLAGVDHDETVGTDQTVLLDLHVFFIFDHIQDSNPFGDTANHIDFGVN